MHLVKIPKDGITSPFGENEHQFWETFVILVVFKDLIT